ncbi:MAG TPA: cytochrome d ubiquinol oxidase subunit II [Alteromonas australica]|jgi:cytochrome d ubiquinol oxidase subunit II|uniref:Cytochrome d ubiquinol oxidase subunit II n=5 Tax=Alteromonas australica TaxID=589873 RepID=A0A353JID2_9ALTE|nr:MULTISPECIES: cytochrome d ubiquinol oxidase subunit II [Alteromonas]MAB93008.1 cytochrome d ubiquinol oxidase subunit II [Alteromonas sp.]AJP45309.1 cytochrome d ubiquinol oxidase subunit 2 [Alteromonas australica]MAF72049.1 cytochrome d ubiquinol oxidase subunit II [Alteromonas sp.]MBU32284.1 cytochrome d ubiquinol oxidase subunit II [Alteromonas sp.]QPL49822.1 cytochrome d ubiquinol oxidase subunit II [Alteromonas sp. B31-7]|tara:strand:- start:14206 stop:15342 length:1137 start_codon:yes stop_codon:yes gene_type:complete
MIDYELLRIIWWCLIGVLLIGFAVTDGFDLGVGALLTLIGRNDKERRVMINTIGPHWDGNQVWFITAGGAIFAAWPMIYATAFSGFYLALALTLIALWMRPIGFDYRSKLPNPQWRNAWDWALFAGGIIPSLIFGVAFGNLLLGVPFELDNTLKSTYTGSFFGLLTPFALLSGVLSVAILLNHGATWLQMKTDGFIQSRARNVSKVLSLVGVACFVLAGVWVAVGIDGFVITSSLDTLATSNPLKKEVAIQSGAWMNNYRDYPLTMIAPVLGIVAGLACAFFSNKGNAGMAFVSSALFIAGVILTAGISMFPFLMPSATMPEASLTVWDATSSHLTLNVMFFVACLFVPIVLSYTAYSFYVMRGRIKSADLDQSHTIY